MKQLGLLVLIAALSSTASAHAQDETESTWSRVLSGAKRLVRDPLGRESPPAPQLPPQLQDDGPRAASVLEPDASTPRRDPQVRPAGAIERPGTPSVAPRRKSTARPLFGRARRPQRTVSEFMAEEKP